MPTYPKTAHILFLDDKNQENMIGLSLAYIIFLFYWGESKKYHTQRLFYQFEQKKNNAFGTTISSHDKQTKTVFWTQEKSEATFFANNMAINLN